MVSVSDLSCSNKIFVLEKLLSRFSFSIEVILLVPFISFFGKALFVHLKRSAVH